MIKRMLVTSLVVALLLTLLTITVSAAPSAPGTPTLRWVRISETQAEIRADGITDGGAAGNGAMNWDIYFRFPVQVNAPYPAVTVQAGPAFLAQAPCGFSTNVTMGLPSEPGVTGDRGVIINGFCGSGVPDNPVIGNDVLVATVTLQSCPSALPQGFVMDLATGIDVVGQPLSKMVDRNNSAYLFQESDLTDGQPMCATTAVTMSGFHATAGNAAPLVATAWPMLAGAGVLAAGGAYALLRRKR